jgi:hypothetical protein
MVISNELAGILNNMNPAAQNAQIGTRLQEALNGEFPSGAISSDELASGAVTADKLASNAVTGAKVAANAITMSKLASGILVGVATEDALTTSREENIAGLASAIALANTLKTHLNAHGADGTDHTTHIDDTNFPVTAPDATNISTLLTLVGSMLIKYAAHEADAALVSGWAFHKAQEAISHALASAVAPTTLQQAITRLNDLQTKYNSHDADASAHGIGSQHQDASPAAAYGTAILIMVAGVLAGDQIVWGIINKGTGNVNGVSAVPGSGIITFTFSADPQNDAVINYAVFRANP